LALLRGEKKYSEIYFHRLNCRLLRQETKRREKGEGRREKGEGRRKREEGKSDSPPFDGRG
jgi:hypothetical protein